MQDVNDPVTRGRREEILEAATILFADKSFEGVTTRDLARAVGINIATIYHYFPDKKSIYEAVADQAQRALSDSLADAASGPERPDVRLARFIATLVRIYTHETPQARLVDRQQIEYGSANPPPTSSPSNIWPTHVAVRQLIDELFDHSLNPAEIDEETRFLISLVYGATKLQPVHRTIGETDPYQVRPLEEHLLDYYSAAVAAKRAMRQAS